MQEELYHIGARDWLQDALKSSDKEAVMNKPLTLFIVVVAVMVAVAIFLCNRSPNACQRVDYDNEKEFLSDDHMDK